MNFKRRTMGWTFMAPAGEEGGAGGGAGGGENPGGTGSGENPGGGSAFAQKTGEGAGEGETSGGAGEGVNPGGGSAFAQKTGEGAGENPGETSEEKEPTRDELVAMSDEDWAKAVLPNDEDAEGHKIDRTFMTKIAETCRTAGISPRQMQKMSAKFQDLAKAEMDAQNAKERECQREIDAANERAAKDAVAAFDDNQWANIRAAGEKYIPADSELGKLMMGPLGSNRELLNILNLLGESLRGDTPPATGAAGGGRSTEEAVVLKTVPGVFLK